VVKTGKSRGGMVAVVREPELELRKAKTLKFSSGRTEAGGVVMG
jgi:hypothetical protein